MDNFNLTTFEAVDNYFKAITKLGYLSKKKTNKLLLLIFINKFLKDYQEFVTEEDYNKVDQIVTCLQGSSCLVPYSKFILASKPVENYLLRGTGNTE